MASLAPSGAIDSGVWRRLGLRRVRQMTSGHQSRVLSADLAGRSVVVKLTDARFVDNARFGTRMEMIAELGRRDEHVIAPIELDGQFVRRLGQWQAVIFPFARGRPPSIDHRPDVSRMGWMMAALHRSLARLEPFDLPPAAALAVPGLDVPDAGPVQLLHGDFSTANLLMHDANYSVLDFDDAGYGPVAFEVANSIFMVLFDATIHGDPGRAQVFREWLVDSYQAESGAVIADDLLDRMIGVRRDALAYWVDHPSSAPIGIRTSTSDWLDRIRKFLDAL